MTTISVIIPAYNAQKTILKTIESVRQQTFTNLEIIIINDGSTDQTLSIVRSINDSRIKVLDYPNGGVSIARNRGINQAKGNYLAFLDADDFWTTDKLELQLKALTKNPQAGVAYSWTYFVYEQTATTFLSEPVYYQGNIYPQLLANNFLHHGSNPLVTRQAINSVGLFNTNFSHCADWDYYLRLAAKWDFVVVPKYQIYYLQSADSMTSKISTIESQLYEMLEITYSNVPQKLQYLKKQTQAWIYQYCTQQYLQHGQDWQSIKNAFDYLSQGILLYPPILLQKYTHNLIKLLLKKSLAVSS
jgi:glycosyltransferase involved in cell wall biosynthesis